MLPGYFCATGAIDWVAISVVGTFRQWLTKCKTKKLSILRSMKKALGFYLIISNRYPVKCLRFVCFSKDFVLILIKRSICYCYFSGSRCQWMASSRQWFNYSLLLLHRGGSVIWNGEGTIRNEWVMITATQWDDDNEATCASRRLKSPAYFCFCFWFYVQQFIRADNKGISKFLITSPLCGGSTCG